MYSQSRMLRSFKNSKNDSLTKVQHRLITASQQGDMEEVTQILNSQRTIDLAKALDSHGNTLLHFAAAEGKLTAKKFAVFCVLLKYLRASSPTTFAEDLLQLKNAKGQTPWHLAAKCGHTDFFEKEKFDAIFQDSSITWNVIENGWLNAEDNEGNIPLHFAASIEENTPLLTINNKKRIIAKLRQMTGFKLNHQNKAKKTALYWATEKGNYPAVRELLKSERIEIDKTEKIKIINNNDFSLRDSKQIPVGNIASTFGHHRIRKLLKYHSVEKVIGDAVELNEAFSDEEVKDLAKDPNTETEDIVDALRPFVAHFNYERIVELAQTHFKASRKKNRLRTILNSLFGATCSAFTLGTTIGVFGGALEPVIMGIVFVITFFPLVYAGYATKLQEDKQKAEELYLSCAAIKIEDLQHKFILKATFVSEKLNKINTQILAATSKEELDFWKEEKVRLARDRQELEGIKKDLDKFYDSARGTGKKPKLKLQFTSQEELKKKKVKAIRDPAKISRWATFGEKVKSFLAYKADILCTTGAVIDIGGVIAGVVLSDAVLGMLGVGGLAGLLGGPIGIAVITVLATLLIATVVGLALYKASYVNGKEEAGEKNKTLILAHDACRNHDYRNVESMMQQMDKKLDETKQNIKTQKTNTLYPASSDFLPSMRKRQSTLFSVLNDDSNRQNAQTAVEGDNNKRVFPDTF